MQYIKSERVDPREGDFLATIKRAIEAGDSGAILQATEAFKKPPVGDLPRTAEDLFQDFKTQAPERYFLGPFAGIDCIRDGLITIGGECNAGKSSLLTALALEFLTAREDMFCLLYSLDDSAEMTAARMLSQATRSNVLQDIQEGRPVAKDPRLRRAYIRDRWTGIETDYNQLLDFTGLKKGVVGIDYLQILPVRGDSLREGLNELVKNIKEIQKRLRCPVFLLSQLNRQGQGHRFRETSEIENQSDACLIITAENSLHGIEATKNKLGPKGGKWSAEMIGGTFAFNDFVRSYGDTKKERPTEGDL